MRRPDVQQLGMFSYVPVEERVPVDHPIRKLRVLVDTILGELDGLPAERYADGGRPSIAPERLLRASLLQVVYSVRSERRLMEQMNYNLLFRWFVGLNIDDAVWDHSTFSFNRDRLFDAPIVRQFFEHTVLMARVQDLVSDEHFSVDGTLLEAWASHKSFRLKDSSGGDGGDFHGQARSNDTPASTTDPDTRLIRKGEGKEAKLSYLANALWRTAMPWSLAWTCATPVARAHAMARSTCWTRRACAVAPPWARTKATHARLRGGAYASRQQAPHCAQHQGPTQRHRCAPGARQGLCDESAGTQAHRAELRLDQDRRRIGQAADGFAAQGARLGDVDVCGVQPDPAWRHRGVVEPIPTWAMTGDVRPTSEKRLLSRPHMPLRR